MTLEALVAFLGSRRFPLNTERGLQDAIDDELTRAGFSYVREARLDAFSIVDFLVEAIAVEVKIKGSKRQIYRQCARYCAHERVAGLILVSSIATGWPPTIAGKPSQLLPLGRAWL